MPALTRASSGRPLLALVLALAYAAQARAASPADSAAGQAFAGKALRVVAQRNVLPFGRLPLPGAALNFFCRYRYIIGSGDVSAIRTSYNGFALMWRSVPVV